MLFSLESNSKITIIPHPQDYDVWRSRLTDAEYGEIIDELNSRIDGTEIQTSSWIPGSDWTGTVFQLIYEKACLQDEDASAKFFGLIVWAVFMQHPDSWAFIRYDDIQGLTYFRIQL